MLPNLRIADLDNDVRIAYIDESPQIQEKGIILLIHGFPQTSYQFRKVIPGLVAAGYVVLSIPASSVTDTLQGTE